MILRSLRVARFRQFRDSVAVANLADGLNVIAGQNELGKSTLLMALRAALFEKYKSTVGESYRPYGQDVSPRVELEFDLNGHSYKLHKVFSSRKDGACELCCTTNNHRWDGPAAEEYLCELIGFSYPGRGPSKPELQGLPGLLWVEQGHAYRSVELNADAQDRLYTVFDSAMSDLLGGESGDALFRRIAELREEYLTQTGRPKGEYKKLQADFAEVEQVLAAHKSKLQEYDSKVEQLQAKSGELKSLERDNAVQASRSAAAAAARALEKIEALESKLESAENKLKQAKAEAALAASSSGARDRLIADEKEVAEQRAKAEAELAVADKALEPIVGELEQCKARLNSAKGERQTAQQALESATLAEKFRQAEETLKQKAAALEKACGAQARLKECRKLKGQIRITEDALTELRALERELSLKRQHLSSAATRIEYRLNAGIDVQLAGKSISDSGEMELTEAASMSITGVGEFNIQPGGDDLSECRDLCEALTEELNQALGKLEVASLEDAERALREAEKLEREIRAHQSSVGAHAPDGIGALESAVEEQKSLVKQLQDGMSEKAASEDSIADIEQQIDKLNQEIETQETMLEDVRSRRESGRDRVSELKAAVNSANRRSEQLETDLIAARAERSDSDLQNNTREAQQQVEIAEAACKDLQLELDASNPYVARSEAERLAKVSQQLESQQQDLKRKVHDLQIELNTLGRNGVAEQLAECEGELEQLSRTLGITESRAAALDLLYQTMSEELSKAKTAVARPIVEKMQPYLRQLLPDASAMIDEDLLLAGIRRESHEEDFEALSLGTREQLAIIIRLAYADLLAEKKIPVTVILDDALVNSDDDRRQRMKAILYHASKKYQVIMLTCHGREYRNAGGHFIDLADAMAAAAREPVSLSA